MATIITALILAFISGLLVGIVASDKLTKMVEEETTKALDLGREAKTTQLALDLNNDGKVDAEDLKIAKTELKKTATQVTKLAKKVK